MLKKEKFKLIKYSSSVIDPLIIKEIKIKYDNLWYRFCNSHSRYYSPYKICFGWSYCFEEFLDWFCKQNEFLKCKNNHFKISTLQVYLKEGQDVYSPSTCIVRVKGDTPEKRKRVLRGCKECLPRLTKRQYYYRRNLLKAYGLPITYANLKGRKWRVQKILYQYDEKVSETFYNS